MWDTFILHLPSNKVCLPLIEARLLWSLLWSLFYYAFEAHNTLFNIWGFTNLLTWLSLGHGSDTMLGWMTLSSVGQSLERVVSPIWLWNQNIDSLLSVGQDQQAVVRRRKVVPTKLSGGGSVFWLKNSVHKNPVSRRSNLSLRSLLVGEQSNTGEFCFTMIGNMS